MLEGVPYTTQSDERDQEFVYNLAICTTVDDFRRELFKLNLHK